MAARRYLHVGGASQPAVHVVAANLHIVCGTSPPKVTVRQHIVKQLRVFLEEFTAPTAGMPIIRLIVGDDNLSTREAKEALQQVREADPLWEVYSAMKQGKGDHVAVSGATAMFIPIAVGKNFHNRGMRCDQHDALCVQLSVPGASQPVKEAADHKAPGRLASFLLDLLRQPFGVDVMVQTHLNYTSVCGFRHNGVRAKVFEKTCMVHWLGEKKTCLS